MPCLWELEMGVCVHGEWRVRAYGGGVGGGGVRVCGRVCLRSKNE